MSPDTTSWILIQRAAAGSPDDRETFAHKYGPVIRSYLQTRWRLPAQDDRILDATQEVFLHCFKTDGALERFDPGRPGGFRAFLYGVVTKSALALERKWARHREFPAGSGFHLEQIETSELTLSRAFDKAWASVVIGEALAYVERRCEGDPLRSDRFRALELRFQQGLSPANVADCLKLPVKRTYQLLRGAKRDFHDGLLEVLAAYYPGASVAELQRKCGELLDVV